MMKKLLIILLVVLPTMLTAQNGDDLTTFILFRHAEKASDGTRDPALTQEGLERAQRLKTLLKNSEPDLILSTPFKRTMSTAEPLAKHLGKAVETYDYRDKNLLTDLVKKHQGKTIVMSGHSNSTPTLVNQLIGSDQYKTLPEDEYGMIFIVTCSEVGRGTVTILSY